MLTFIQSWLTAEANPIGVDFGTDSLRLAQVELVENEFRLVAAASAEVPAELRRDNTLRLSFLTQTTRDLLTQGEFRGRRAILGLPASCMQIHHLRLPPGEEASPGGALPGAVRDRMRIDPQDTLLRHVVAGRVEQDGALLDEVIVMAAQRTLVEELLHAAAKARLDVIAMNVEPKAVVDCFSHVYRRRGDGECTSCYVDIGASATRVVVARGQQIFFARAIPVAGDDFSRAVAAKLHTTPDAARVFRVNKRAAISEASRDSGRSGAAESPVRDGQRVGPRDPAASAAEAERTRALHQQIDRACSTILEALIAALADCRRDHEASFPSNRIDRLIFVGGEACDRGLCQTIAHSLQIPGCVGDPLVRMGRISSIRIESGIDRRMPQPAWAVAIGLSMGPAAAGAALAVNKVS